MKHIKALLLATIIALTGTAQAEFPDRPIKIILSLPVGSGPDVVVRKVAEQLTAKWGQPVIVENKPGGNGVVALEAYKKEPATGYSLLFSGVGEIITYPIITRTEDSVASLEPLVPMMRSEMMLITSPNNKTLGDVREAFKKNPSIGSWGIASPPHLNGLELSQHFDTTPIHVPYKDYNQWFIDVSSGQVTWSFATMASAGKLEKAGKLKFVAITGDKRDPDYPDVPTITELTGKKVDFKPWVAFYANKAVPIGIQKKLTEDIIEAVNSKPVVDTLLAMTYKPWKINQPEFQTYFAGQTTLYKKLINQHKITVD